MLCLIVVFVSVLLLQNGSWAVPTQGPAQGGSSPHFAVQAILSQTRILPYEPLAVFSTLTNVSQQPHTLTGGFRSEFYIGRDGQKEWQWQMYHRAGQAIDAIAPYTKTFQPEERIRGFCFIDVGLGEKHVFAQPGTYWIKAVFNGIESEPQRVEVTEPSPRDQAAFQYLQMKPLYHYFSAEAARNHLQLLKYKAPDEFAKLEPNRELEQFATKFPDSWYTQWVQLGSLFAREMQLNSTWDASYRLRGASLTEQARLKYHERLLELQTEMEQMAPKLRVPLNAVCWFEAALVAKLRNDRSAAEANFNKAIETKASTVMEEQVKIFNRGWPQPPKPPVDAVYKKTVQDLEAQYYDVRGFMEKYRKENDEWFMASREATNRLHSGKMSLEEWFRIQAELLRKYVPKYSKPVTPEEWRRLQEKHMMEEIIRSAE